MSTNPPIHDDVKKFLGVNNDEEVTVVAGQKADDAALANAQDAYLVSEACEYGDGLVRYVINHMKLNNEQRAWAVVLGILCSRDEYPEGVATFDELAEKGGDEIILEQTSRSALDHIVKTALAESAVFEEAAKFAELFAKYIAQLKRTLGVSNPQAAYGIGRALRNMRDTFPEESGGPAGFDHWASEAGEYFRKR